MARTPEQQEAFDAAEAENQKNFPSRSHADRESKVVERTPEQQEAFDAAEAENQARLKNQEDESGTTGLDIQKSVVGTKDNLKG